MFDFIGFIVWTLVIYVLGIRTGIRVAANKNYEVPYCIDGKHRFNATGSPHNSEDDICIKCGMKRYN